MRRIRDIVLGVWVCRCSIACQTENVCNVHLFILFFFDSIESISMWTRQCRFYSNDFCDMHIRRIAALWPQIRDCRAIILNLDKKENSIVRVFVCARHWISLIWFHGIADICPHSSSIHVIVRPTIEIVDTFLLISFIYHS